MSSFEEFLLAWLLVVVLVPAVVFVQALVRSLVVVGIARSFGQRVLEIHIGRGSLAPWAFDVAGIRVSVHPFPGGMVGLDVPPPDGSPRRRLLLMHSAAWIAHVSPLVVLGIAAWGLDLPGFVSLGSGFAVAVIAVTDVFWLVWTARNPGHGIAQIVEALRSSSQDLAAERAAALRAATIRRAGEALARGDMGEHRRALADPVLDRTPLLRRYWLAVGRAAAGSFHAALTQLDELLDDVERQRAADPAPADAERRDLDALRDSVLVARAELRCFVGQDEAGVDDRALTAAEEDLDGVAAAAAAEARIAIAALRGRPDEARRHLRRLAGRTSSRFPLAIGLSWVALAHARIGRDRRAAKLLSRARRVCPANPLLVHFERWIAAAATRTAVAGAR